MRYNNYHKHTHYSNIATPDVVVKPKDYIKHTKELGHTTYFTTEHKYGGNPWEAYDLCKKEDLKLIYGVEAYYVDNRHEKDRSNYHIILIAKNKQSYNEINSILSIANKDGFYYQPRLDLELLLKLTPEYTIITTACVAGRINGENTEEKFIKPLHNHFNGNFYLEVQNHPHPTQANYNKKILELSQKYNIEIIHANDSHYLMPEQAKDRELFLRGKGIYYEQEDGFILDYPDYQTILKRYKKQNILTEEQANKAIKNTLVFDECEDLGFTKEIKMPSIYPNVDKNKKLKNILNRKWQQEKLKISKEKHKYYLEEIRKEMNIIEKTDMADYFLLNERIIDKAVNEYGGVLSRTGRGSAVSFYINKLLGFTEIDRIAAPIPLYPTRFMSVSRILETGSLPDIDFNTSDPHPFIKAGKDILGEDNIHWMIAYGSMKESEAFRNLCRAKNLQMDEYNEVAKNIEEYKDNSRWKDLIKQSEKYIGVIDSVSPSPCSFLLLDKPISEEIGLIKVGDKICCCIDGYTSDVQGYLKNDFLTVTVWDIIAKTFKEIGKPIPDIKELTKELDEEVWQLYEKGLTATLNQTDSNFATPLVKKYAPKSVAELSMWVSAIRPGFASLLNTFLNREKYSTGIKELDMILKDSHNFMLFQESAMKYLTWCGIKEDETYGIIKKISKKKFKQDELKELKKKLAKGFEKNTGNKDKFEATWKVIEDSVFYMFNASHAYSVALDSLYGAYLKAKYPLEYYTVVLNIYENDIDRTNKIIHELPHFNISLEPIKFGKSRNKYTYDKEKNIIYKNLSSIKFINSKVAEELYQLSQQKNYTNFLDLLIDIKENTSANSKQLNILITLNFFSEFGKNQKLLNFINLFQEFYDSKRISKSKVDELNLDHTIFEKFSRPTEKTYMEFDYYNFLQHMWDQISNKPLDIQSQLIAEIEYLGYCETKADKPWVIVTDINTKYTPKITVYSVKTGADKTYKISRKKFYNKQHEPLLQKYDLIRIKKVEQKKKWKPNNEDEFEQIDEYEDWIEGLTKIKFKK